MLPSPFLLKIFTNSLLYWKWLLSPFFIENGLYAIFYWKWSLSPFLSKMIPNGPISTGQISESLKKGFIIPVFKSGDRCEAKNYRPVTLTSHFIKIFERILVWVMVGYFEKNDLFDNNLDQRDLVYLNW